MTPLVHIAPQLPPAVDGVGDYCHNLWRHWLDRSASWHFLALRGTDASQQHWPEVAIHGFSPNAASLHGTLETAAGHTVVLHYVGYGYQPKGIPLWLPAALAQWKAGGTQRRLVTMFHEMYATSSPLRSPFWVMPWARRIMRSLVASSDAWVTSCDAYFDWLVREFAAAPEKGQRIPIGSNIPFTPRATADAPAPGGQLKLVLFGLPNTRLWALQRHHELMRAMVGAGLVDSILLLGKRDDSPAQTQSLAQFQRAIGGQWKTAYDLSPTGLSAKLAASDIGFVANDAGTLTKSGVFAAMAANGVVCVAAPSKGYQLRAPFRDGVLVNDEQPAQRTVLLATCGDAARLQTLRSRAMEVSQSELAWPKIAAAWARVLASTETSGEQSDNSPANPAHRPGASVRPVAEVRA